MRGTRTKLRGDRARKKCVITRNATAIADSPQSEMRGSISERKRCDELVLEITSQKNTLVRRNNDEWIYTMWGQESSREKVSSGLTIILIDDISATADN